MKGESVPGLLVHRVRVEGRNYLMITQTMGKLTFITNKYDVCYDVMNEMH